MINIFVKTEDHGKSYILKTNYVSVEFNREYDIVVNSSPERIVCHRISCNSNRVVDIRAFLSVVQSYIEHASVYDLSSEGLTDFFHAIVRLFKVEVDKDSKTARQGLWGELFLMKNFGGFDFWSEHWHADPLNMFDFSAVGKKVEVKTTLKPERIHAFSHGQLFSSEDVKIVSILLRNEDTGLSLKALIEEARESFRNTAHYFKLEKAVRIASMDGLDEEGPSFSESYARDNLAWFFVGHVPHFSCGEPEGVTSTHYSSDLTKAPRMTSNEVENWLSSWPTNKVQ